MKKNRIIVLIISAIFLILVVRIVYTVIQLAPYEYRPETGFDSRYLWIFKDSVASELKDKYSISNKNDGLYIYDYKQTYNFLIWELKDYQINDIENIKVKRNYKLTELSPPKTFFSYGGKIDVQFKTKPVISSKIGLNFGIGSEVCKELDNRSFHMFSGLITKFGISDESETVHAIFDYGSRPVNLSIIFYKARSSIFIIIISPVGESSLNEGALKLLKLQ